MYKVGCSKVDITGYVYNKAMMGYAVPFHVVKGVETPIYVRAIVIQDIKTNTKMVMVNAEICFYSIALQDAIIKKLQATYPDLGYTHDNVMLTAQHTHSAPGGHSHYMLYNLAIPGFQPKVFENYLNGTVEAIVTASQNLEEATISYIEGAFAPQIKVAYNRSMAAYNANPEVTPKVLKKDHHLAIDRTMKLLRFDRPDGSPIASWNWFGVHTTSVNNDYNKICSDNKGYAAYYMEKEVCTQSGNPDFIAVFAQDTAGDVSPNYQWNNKNGFSRGKYEEDDYKSARYTGKLQYKKAMELFKKAPKGSPIKGKIDGEHFFVDMSAVEVDVEFTNGKKGLHTSPPATGASLFTGASDRPPAPAVPNFFIGIATKTASNIVEIYEKSVFKLFSNRKEREEVNKKYKGHYPKRIVLETGRGKILGTYKIKDLIVPGAADPTVKRLKAVGKNGYARRTPWMPNIIPLQICILGSIALVGMPAEITTIAGQRMRKSLLKILKHRGVQKIMLAAYCNGYSGYITTPEEYDVQMYEGGHTIYGRYTLAAYQTKLKELAIQLLKKPADRQLSKNIKPDIFKKEEIWYGED